MTRRLRAVDQRRFPYNDTSSTQTTVVAPRPGRRWGRPRARLAGILAAAVLCAVTAGCGGTSGSSGDYRVAVADATRAAHSTINIAELDAELVRDDKTLAAELRVSLQQAYSDANSALSGFDAVLPPGRSDVAQQQRLDSALSAAVTMLLQMRVLAAQGREAALPPLIPQLRAISVRLQGFEQLP